MKLLLLLFSTTTVIVTLLASVASQTTQQCPSPLRARREINRLSSREVSDMRTTLTKMNRLGWWSWFSFLHIKFYDKLHGKPEFLPWHRRFTREVELTVQYYQPSFNLPYFDAAAVCSNPASSIIFSDSYFGGNGRSSDRCITSGMANGWKMLFPNNECLKRSFNGDSNTIKPWQCPESITRDIQTSKNFGDMSYRVELGLHGSVHNSIGGDMVGHHSPNDFIFFLHHSNIDRIWLKWQNLNTSPSIRYQYSDYNNKPVDINSSMTVFSEPIINSFDVGYGLNCYAYDDTTPVLRTGRPAQVDTGLLSKRDSSTSQGVTTDPSAIRQVTSVPDMSLATALDQATLAKFFPLLAANNTPAAAVIMPNVVGPRAIKYASLWQQGRAGSKKGSRAMPLSSDSLQTSVTDTSNQISDSSTNLTPQSFSANIVPAAASVAANPAGSNGGNNVAGNIPQEFKYPIPVRLSDDYLKMMNYDMNRYNLYYQEQVDLANALNSKGYVSPYI